MEAATTAAASPSMPHPGDWKINILNKLGTEKDQLFYVFMIACGALVIALCTASSSVSS
jgi:hypothetical protein